MPRNPYWSLPRNLYWSVSSEAGPERDSAILPELHSQGALWGGAPCLVVGSSLKKATLGCVAKALIGGPKSVSLEATVLVGLCGTQRALWLLLAADAGQWVCECGEEVGVGGSLGTVADAF